MMKLGDSHARFVCQPRLGHETGNFGHRPHIDINLFIFPLNIQKQTQLTS